MGMAVDLVAKKLLPALCPSLAQWKLSELQLKEILDTCRDCLSFIEDAKFSNNRLSTPPSARLAVTPVRPQRHSIGGQIPEVLVTSHLSPSGEAAASFSSFDDISIYKNSSSLRRQSIKLGTAHFCQSVDYTNIRRKSMADVLLETIMPEKTPPATLQEFPDNSLPSPSSPPWRRRSDVAKPNTLTNLGHNLACTLWKRRSQ